MLQLAVMDLENCSPQSDQQSAEDALLAEKLEVLRCILNNGTVKPSTTFAYPFKKAVRDFYPLLEAKMAYMRETENQSEQMTEDNIEKQIMKSFESFLNLCVNMECAN